MISTVTKIIYTPASSEMGFPFPHVFHGILLFSLLWSQGDFIYISLLAKDAEHPEAASEDSFLRCYHVSFSHESSVSEYVSLSFLYCPCCFECCYYCSLSRNATQALPSFGTFFLGGGLYLALYLPDKFYVYQFPWEDVCNQYNSKIALCMYVNQTEMTF